MDSEYSREVMQHPRSIFDELVQSKAIIVASYGDILNHRDQARTVVLGSEVGFGFSVDSRGVYEISRRVSLATLADLPFKGHTSDRTMDFVVSAINEYGRLAEPEGLSFLDNNYLGDRLADVKERMADYHASTFADHHDDIFRVTIKGLEDEFYAFKATLFGNTELVRPRIERNTPLQIEELTQVPADSWLAQFWDLSDRLGVRPAQQPVAARTFFPQESPHH